jgi:hypothetical protein
MFTSAIAEFTIIANKAPIDQRSKRLFKILFLVKTAMGKTIALSEHKWNGKYSIGEPQLTRLKMMAHIPEKDKMPSTMDLTLSDLFLNIKNNPVIMPPARNRVRM